MTQIDHESLGPEHLELLSRARDASGMPPAAKTRVLARLGASPPPGAGEGPDAGASSAGGSGPGPGAPASGGPLQPSLSVATPGSIPAWVSVTLVGLAVVSFGAVAAAPVVGVPDPEDIVVERPSKERPEPAAPLGRDPTPEESVAAEPQAEPAGDPEPAADTDGTTEVPRAASNAQTPPETASKKASAASIKEETALLSAARKALGNEDPKGALARLEVHAKRFPKGALLEEREALTAVALCEDGQTLGGERAARQFLASHGTSGLAPRVRAACGLEEK